MGPDDTEAAGAKMDLGRLLDTVSPRSRGLVRAVRIEGRSIEEVSRTSGMSPSAVKVAVHRALKSISDRVRSGKRP